MAGGRPPKYKAEYDEQAYKLCLLGATDEELGNFFEVDERTINRWKKTHPKFCQSLKKGKVVADAEVAESLFKRACGYEHPEDKIFVRGNTTTGKDGVQTERSEVVRVGTVKHYPPDTAAAFIWLKNRAGWKDKQEVEIEASKSVNDLREFLLGRNSDNTPNQG